MSHIGLNFFPAQLQAVILFCLLGVAVLQWIVTLPLVRHFRYFSSIGHCGRHVTELKAKYPKNVKPFSKDIFYILWNVLPIFLLASYLYVWFHWNEWNSAFEMHFSSDYRDIRADLDGVFSHWAMTGSMLLVALAGAFVLQPLKQMSFYFNEPSEIHEGTYVYWWDYRNSKSIFVIRMIALFLNTFTVFVVGLTLVKLTLLVSIVAFSCDVAPSVFHPDGMGGLGGLRKLSLLIAFTCLIVSGTGIVSILDHKRQGATHMAGSLCFLFMFLPTILILTAPMLRVHSKLKDEYSAMTQSAGQRAQESLRELNGFVEAGDRQAVEKWYRDRLDEHQMLSAAMTGPEYPVDFQLFIGLLLSWVSPVVVFRLFRLGSFLRRVFPEATV